MVPLTSMRAARSFVTAHRATCQADAVGQADDQAKATKTFCLTGSDDLCYGGLWFLLGFGERSVFLGE